MHTYMLTACVRHAQCTGLPPDHLRGGQVAHRRLPADRLALLWLLRRRGAASRLPAREHQPTCRGGAGADRSLRHQRRRQDRPEGADRAAQHHLALQRLGPRHQTEPRRVSVPWQCLCGAHPGRRASEVRRMCVPCSQAESVPNASVLRGPGRVSYLSFHRNAFTPWWKRSSFPPYE